MGKSSTFDPNDSGEKTVILYKDAKGELRTQPTREFSIHFTVIMGKEPDFGKHFSFSKDRISIGRDNKNDVPIHDEMVSKFHCEVYVAQNHQLEQVVIKDLNSTNGTYVNGSMISQMILKPGDKLELGETVLRVGYNDEIEREYHSKLFDFAARDTLTGLYNKRFVLSELESHFKIARRNKRLFSIIIFDIDNFKDINDTFGHLAGDAYLKKVGQILNDTLREQDISGRVGGEEFLIIIPETKLQGAMDLAERFRKKVESSEIIFQDQSIRATISAGVSQFELGNKDWVLLVKEADDALYRAKRKGKNKVERAIRLDEKDGKKA
jgi:diguanylate cyclase (GGDEF)-like protein